MPRCNRLAPILFGLMLFFASGIVPARAGLVASASVVVAPEAGGMSLYTYTVAVDPTSTLAASEFDLNLTSVPVSGIGTPVGAPLSAITMPTGFINLYTSGDPTISFYSTDPSTDIAPGTSEVFSFISTSNPTMMQPYQLTSFDGSGGTVMGSVLGPTTLPEPSGLVLSGLAIMGFIGCAARARWRKRAA